MVPTQWEESDPKCAGAAAALLAPLALESTTAPSPRLQEKVNGARDCCGVWMLATERVVGAAAASALSPRACTLSAWQVHCEGVGHGAAAVVHDQGAQVQRHGVLPHGGRLRPSSSAQGERLRDKGRREAERESRRESSGKERAATKSRRESRRPRHVGRANCANDATAWLRARHRSKIWCDHVHTQSTVFESILLFDSTRLVYHKTAAGRGAPWRTSLSLHSSRSGRDANVSAILPDLVCLFTVLGARECGMLRDCTSAFRGQGALICPGRREGARGGWGCSPSARRSSSRRARAWTG